MIALIIQPEMKMYVILCENMTLKRVTGIELLTYIYYIHTKVELHVNYVLNIDHKCTGSLIKKLCEARDSCRMHIIETRKIKIIYCII